MFKSKIYKRFEKIYKYFYDNDKIIQTFHTKLGDRKIACIKPIKGTRLSDMNGNLLCDFQGNDDIVLIYKDKEEDVQNTLFLLRVDKKGNINILISSNIDEPAIFSAIYELECLIYKDKKHKNGQLLKELLSYYGNSNFGSGVFPFRWWNNGRN